MGEFTINGTPNSELITKGETKEFKPSFLLPLGRITTIHEHSGDFLFQDYHDERFSIWLSEYRTNEPVTIYATVERRMLELSFVIADEMNYKMEGFGHIRMPGSSFNLSHEPYVENKLFLRQGKAMTFDVHIQEDYLQDLFTKIPGLGPFLEQMTKDAFILLRDMPKPVSFSIQSMINSILHAGNTTGIIKSFLQSQTEALLLMALSDLTNSKPLPTKASAHEASAVIDLERYLTENLDTQLTIPELSKKYAVNEWKLKRLFREKYGVGIHEFLTEKRLSKARYLLKNSLMPIYEISYTVGYRNPDYLAEVFKSKYQMTPLQYRLRS